MIRETYWQYDDTLTFFNGDKVLVHIAIDKDSLYRLVHQATKNKTRFAKSGPLTVEAKKL